MSKEIKKIIGFYGKKQSGKTTACMFFNKMIPSVIIPMARPLKFIVKTILGATINQIDGTDEEKNSLLPCGISARKAMQLVGTDWFRSVDPDCWIRAFIDTIKSLEESDTTILVPDIRFPNEVKAIQAHNGAVIKLLRNPCSPDTHKSETVMDDAPVSFFDLVVDNRAMSIDKQNITLWELLCNKGWIK